ncbi:MAG: undecaprenyldiphospho-muramoylpentapeptide beta-N-acetylglucosaminyltransferase [Coriobacteriia bacterium]|nr:undecaprenyldiphospho-muramoylpentapeptide beta-N-acetylglucosaminyltransferase [Coriobacteriia bacterium]
MHVLMSGGGTAGHIYPALTVAALFTGDGPDSVTYVGTASGPEARLARDAGVRFEALPARGFDRSRPWSLFVALGVLGVSILRSLVRMGRVRPDVVVGFGGYVCVPVSIAAIVLRIPLVLHEQNSVPGLANRILSRWAAAVAVTYAGSAKHLHRGTPVTVTGNPVRAEILRSDPVRGRSFAGLPEGATVLLVFGGSRGSRHLNEAMMASRASFLGISPDVHIVHVTGREEYSAVIDCLEPEELVRYHVIDYAEDMGSLLAASDVVVARAGATSIAEITALGRPAVLVPYPYATDDHQTLNARTLVEQGGALLVPDEMLDDPMFVDSVTALLVDDGARATMSAASAAVGRPDAASRVARMIEDIVHGRTTGDRL